VSETFTVLHLRASNFVGGPENQILLYAECERSGPISTLIGTFVGRQEGAEFLETSKRHGLETLRLPTGWMGHVRAISSLLDLLSERRVSLVCTHGYLADLLGTLAGRLRGVPVAWFLHGWTGENWKVRIYEALDRAFLPLASRIVCLSNLQAGRLAGRRSQGAKVRVVVNAVETTSVDGGDRALARQDLCRRYGLAENSALVVAAGRLSPEKGTENFVRAAPRVRERFPAARFIVFGDGPLRTELEGVARAACPNGEVLFAGHVKDFRRLLPGADVLVNASLSEEMPNVVLEAMAAGVPVVATNVGGVAEIAGNPGPEPGRRDGLILIPPSNPAAIADAVSDLLSDSACAKEQGHAGQQRVREAFSPDRQCAALRALYEELIPGLAGSWERLQVPSGSHEKDKEETVSALRDTKPLPFISVVVPVRNEEAHLGFVLEDLLRQEYPRHRYEILVVDGGSTDRTAAVRERYALGSPERLRALPSLHRWSSAGRNVGVRASRGEIVVFVDGHCRIPSRTLLADTARLFEETGADALARPQPLTMSGNTPFQEVVAHVRATALGHGRDSTIYAADREGFVNPTSSGASYRRSVFGRVGMYDESFDACEDVEFNFRVWKGGLRSFFSPALAVYYQPRASFGGLFAQLVRYGRGRFALIRKHRDALSFSQLVPAGLVAWLVAGGLGAIQSFILREALLATVVIYTALVLGFSAVLAVRHGWRHFFVAPCVFVTIHVALGTGAWLEFGRGFLKMFRGRMSSDPRAPDQTEAGLIPSSATPDASSRLEESPVRVTRDGS
jgi:succinoglycan biosynthesis protein ExoA